LARFAGSGVVVLCCRGVFSLLCAFRQCFSVFSPLCSCVGQVLFGRIKIVFVTAFFLMKNVLRHGCEKKEMTRWLAAPLPKQITSKLKRDNFHIIQSY